MGDTSASFSHSDRIRLHITPFTEELHDRVIPASLRPLTGNISYHTVQTFPEKSFGFVDLPSMEAEKLRKKLNGSTLKGTKIAIEEAKPSKKRKSGEDGEKEESERKRAKRERKERKKQENGVLPGHELDEGRRVKRGWTGDESREKKDKKKDGKSKKSSASETSEGRKLRFKTAVPDNRLPHGVEGEKKKAKKDKKGSKEKVVVEEYTKRKKSKALPPVDIQAHGTRTYEEGKGWVDEAGEVVEAERKSKRRRERVPSPVRAASVSDDGEQAVAGATEEASGGRQSSPSVDDEPENSVAAKEKALTVGAQQTPQASKSSDHDASDDSSDDNDTSAAKAVDEQTNGIHPLEALFKRPATGNAEPVQTTPTRPRPAPIDTSFSFFGSGAPDDENEDEDTTMQDNPPPVTPHTKQDLEWRSLRSAAPTPDTAAIGRKFSLPFARHLEDEEDEEAEDKEDEDMPVDTPQAKADNGSPDGRGEESAFRKWFFEHRGDLNRGWKKRRREERKTARQRENRRIGRKVA